MTYDPNRMPETQEEFDLCVDHCFQLSQAKYEAAVLKAKNQAEAAYAKLPESEDKPTLADFIAQVVSMVPPAKTGAEIEQELACYKPAPMPEYQEPEFTLPELKQQKLAELHYLFKPACDNATVMTPSGWAADANETAYRNVQGLLITMENTGVAAVQFCDAENNFHEVSQQELAAVQQLIIGKGQSLYARKWEIREAINQAQSKEELAAIAITFA